VNDPIFVLSCARSGSTLTRLILDTHPDVYSPPELNLGPLARSLCMAVFLLEGREEGRWEEHVETLERARAILSGLLDSYVQRKGKKIWCEKTPRNVFHRELLAAIFPEARFICLHRHALDVVWSCLEGFRYGFSPMLQDYIQRFPGDHVQGVVSYWTDVTAGMLDFERRRPGQTFRLRYEDLVRDPDGTLAPMFRFLGLEWSPALTAAVFSSEHDRGGAYGGDTYALYSGRISRDSLGAGRKLSTAKLPVELRERMLALLGELGYPEMPEGPPDGQAPRAGGESAPPDLDARWFFEELLPERIGSAGPPPVPLSCDFVIRGAGGGAWALRWDAEGLRVGPGSASAPARVELAAADLAELVQGRINALKLVEEGRLRVEGLQTDEALVRLLKLCWT